MPQRRSLSLLLLIAGLLLPASALARGNAYLERGIAQLNRAEDEQALRSLRLAVSWSGSTAAEITTAHLYLGIAYFNLSRETEAERCLRIAFQRDRDARLPGALSPKVIAFAERIRSELAVPVYHGGTPQPDPGDRVAPPRLPVPASRPHDSGESRMVSWPAWLALGAAAVAGGTGLALGVVARQKADEASDLTLPCSEADSRHATAERYAIGANVLFAVAGAAAITSGVLFYLSSGRSPNRASVAPVPGGAVVTYQGVSW